MLKLLWQQASRRVRPLQRELPGQIMARNHCGVFLTCFSNVTQFISIQCCFNFSIKILHCWWENWTTVVGNTSQRFSVGLRFGHRGGHSTCENDVSWSLDHSFTIWAHWILALPPTCPRHQRGKKNPLMELPGLSIYLGSPDAHRLGVNLDSSDQKPLFHCSKVQSLCSLQNWSLFFLPSLTD